MAIKFKKGKLISGIIYPKFFPLTEEDSVLNVGCGDGVQALVYKGKFKKMIGVDINEERLATARALMKENNIANFVTVQADVESIPLDEQFDKCIAIDIIEHVIHPNLVLKEMHRLTKAGGRILITFPAMHDKWENFFKFVGRKILRRHSRTVIKEGWDPDQHQYDYNLKQWLGFMSANGWQLKKSRASTLWPPLHYLGLPRFWFSNRFIHTIDDKLCRLDFLKNWGQALVCVFEKK
ncbi:MAG: class I SAM-dependent methyltransferase [Patescibacteria group bacterium]